MRFLIVLICVVLVCKVYSQELGDVETQRTTEFPSKEQIIDWDITTQKDNSQLRKPGIIQSLPNPYYGRMFLPLPNQRFGTRIQQNNDSLPQARHFSGPEGPPDNYASADSYPQQRYPFQYPIMYYPQPLISSVPEHAPRGSKVGNPGGLYNPAPDGDNGGINLTAPQLPIYPEFAAERIHRREQYPIPFGNLPSPDFFLRGDPGVRNLGNSFPFAPYPYPPVILPPSIASSDEERVDIFVRPQYFDRETGTNSHDRVPPKQEMSEEKSVAKQPEEAETTFSDISIPAESIPPRYIPRRPLPVPSFPYGIPPAGLVPPFAYPAGVIPPTPPPAAYPNFPILADENLIASVLNKPRLPPPTAEPGLLTSELQPAETLPLKETEIISGQSEDYIDNEAKIPYEFGYEMNDGRGTDQHRKEVADGSGAVKGSYGYRDPFGVYRIVNYVADKNGFRAFIQSNEPGIANPGSADVTVVAEMPPLKAVAEGLRTLKVDAIEVPDVPVETIAEVNERK